MSVVGGYPEKKPENLPPIKVVGNPIFDAGVVAGQFDNNFYGNAIEASIVAPEETAAHQDFQAKYNSVQETAYRHAAAFIRQTQALETLGGLFFESLNRAHAQAGEFVNRDSLEQMRESPAEIAWRAKLVAATKGKLVIPTVSKGIEVSITPHIRTQIPSDTDSKQVGYLQTSGAYAESGTAISSTSPSSYLRFTAPLFTSVQIDHPFSINTEGLTSTQDPEYYRHTAASLLADAYRSLSGEELQAVTQVEIVSVVPGISETGPIESIDFCIDMGRDDFSYKTKSPDYWVELLQDGRRTKGLIMDTYGNRQLGPTNDKIPFITMPGLPEALPRPSGAAFSREKEDMTISVIGVPVRTFSESKKSELNPALRVSKHEKSAYNSVYVQPDTTRACFIAHIAIIGSY